MIRKSLALLAMAASLLAAQPIHAQEHVVAPADLTARLAAAESSRQGHLDTLEQLLSRPEAAPAAAAVGADLARVRAALPTLSDEELAQLAARAAALDPVAGLDQDIRTLLIIFLIVAIVILVLQAVD